jgi:hypothetical protein
VAVLLSLSQAVPEVGRAAISAGEIQIPTPSGGGGGTIGALKLIACPPEALTSYNVLALPDNADDSASKLEVGVAARVIK